MGWDLERIAPLLPGKATDRGFTARDNRLFLEALFRRVRTGAPWWDLPLGFGKWNSQFCPFQRWATSGVCERLFQALSGHPHLEYTPARGRHCPSLLEGRWRKRGTQHQAIGQSRGGLTTKSVALMDAMGSLMRFLLLPGQDPPQQGSHAPDQTSILDQIKRSL